MGWTTITQNVIWQPATFVNEFLGAIRERRNVLGWIADTWADISAGVNIQSHDFWGEMQEFLETWCVDFIQSHDTDGTPRAVGYYDNIDSESDITQWTLANWRTASGFASGFRRATTSPADWTDYSDAAFVAAGYGTMQVGDVIGPWIFQDLQDGLNTLVWTRDGLRQWGDANWKPAAGDYYHGQATPQIATWAASKTDAENDWARVTHAGDPGQPPMASTRGLVIDNPPFYHVDADAYRRRDYLRAGATTDCACAAEFYARAAGEGLGGTAQFDVNGDGPPLVEDKLILWQTDDPATDESGSRVSSTMLGGIAFPNWCADPTSPVAFTNRGYIVDEQAVIFRWDVTNGFVYT